MRVRSDAVGSPHLSSSAATERTARLASASRELETVLESIDLAENPEFADALVEAVAATTRAYDLAAATGEDGRSDPDDRSEERSEESASSQPSVPGPIEFD
jgi:hypothetical protein